MKKVNPFFTAFTDKWPTEAGPVPNGDQFNAAVALTVALANGRSMGLGLESLNLAMCLRKGGCSVEQYLYASKASGAAHNKRRNVERAGYCLGGRLPGGIGKSYAYTLVLTPKGESVVKAYNAGTAKPVAAKAKPVTAKPVAPVKPKAPRKPKAPKPVAPQPVEVPQPVEAAPTETQAA